MRRGRQTRFAVVALLKSAIVAAGIALFPAGSDAQVPVSDPPQSKLMSKLGSILGPFAAEYRDETGWNTQNKPKRDNRLVHRLLVRDQRFESSLPDH
jgi:hypothetical protein